MLNLPRVMKVRMPMLYVAHVSVSFYKFVGSVLSLWVAYPDRGFP
jgi:hypothetical protein